ncbi:MAG: xanthine dehydrogenase family protein molybdopterin-binding subunit [Alphaproteobacteria bacterium]|nr:xanthine dehydrogenase family protein molybdopterin-binding subunit [Alphaproteobacteria bacterium]
MIDTKLPLSLTDNPILSQWIAFNEPGRVRVGSGKVEIGQGILTALTQIAAEELDLGVEQVNLVSGQTDVSPAEGFTSGSYSIAVGGASIRLVCAEVRALFLDRLAETLKCPVAELSVANGKFLRNGKGTGRDYWSMAVEIDLERRASGTAPVKKPSSYRIVGKHLPRLDLPAKISGKGFVHDMAPNGVLHARVLRQPWRGAHLAALDEAAVRKAAQAPIDILREGEFVAFTSADETAIMRAAEAARTLAKWDGGAPVPDDAGTPDWLKRQSARSRTVETGVQTPAQGNRVVEASFSRPFLTYSSIGTACALAEWKDGHLNVWSHTQGPAVLRDWLARALKLEARQVTVIHTHGAGAYGHNTADDAAFDASFLAMRHPGRTIRVQWSREDEFLGAPISTAMAIDLRAVLDADNKPADWTIEIWSPPHAQRPGMNGNANFSSETALPNPLPMNPLGDVPDERGGGATRNAVAIYDLPRHRLVHHLLPEVPIRTSSLRGLGAWANVYAIEMFIDELAELAGEDPIAYRLSLLSDPRPRRVVETAAKISGWFDKPKLPEGTARGFGFARYKNIAAFAAVVVEAEVAEDIRLKRIWCAADAGLVISPDGARNQVEGGIIMGASFVMREQVKFAGGRVANSTWDDYPILRFSDIPDIDIELIDNPNEPALGLGEASVGPTGAAIGNAVARALGKRIRDLPLTRERIVATLMAD